MSEDKRIPTYPVGRLYTKGKKLYVECGNCGTHFPTKMGVGHYRCPNCLYQPPIDELEKTLKKEVG